MAYITESEYKTITGEAQLPDGYTSILAMAEAAVDAATLYGYVGWDLSALHAYAADRLKQAVAYQVQYIAQMGGVSGANDAGGDYGSVSLGRFSYSQSSSGRTSGSSAVSGELPLAKPAEAYIPFLLAYARGLKE